MCHTQSSGGTNPHSSFNRKGKAFAATKIAAPWTNLFHSDHSEKPTPRKTKTDDGLDESQSTDETNPNVLHSKLSKLQMLP